MPTLTSPSLGCSEKPTSHAQNLCYYIHARRSLTAVIKLVKLSTLQTKFQFTAGVSEKCLYLFLQETLVMSSPLYVTWMRRSLIEPRYELNFHQLLSYSSLSIVVCFSKLRLSKLRHFKALSANFYANNFLSTRGTIYFISR